jgi:hypothetical protein
MAWTTPITVATNDLLSAAQYNQSVRDNLMETAPAKASGPGNIFTTADTNKLIERDVTSVSIGALESTASFSYGDLDTVGPIVSVNCHAAIIMFSARMRNTNAADGKGAYVAVQVSGTSSAPAADNLCVSVGGLASASPMRASGMMAFTAPAEGRYTFTMKYRCQSGYPSAQFDQRNLTVIPL